MFKNISSENIDFEDGYISKIDGIEFSNRKVSVVKNLLYNQKTEFNENITYLSEEDKKKNLSHYWTAYLQEIKSSYIS